jgi:hypothetical protein
MGYPPQTHSLGTHRIKAVAVVWHLPSKAKVDNATIPKQFAPSSCTQSRSDTLDARHAKHEPGHADAEPTAFSATTLHTCKPHKYITPLLSTILQIFLQSPATEATVARKSGRETMSSPQIAIDQESIQGNSLVTATRRMSKCTQSAKVTVRMRRETIRCQWSTQWLVILCPTSTIYHHQKLRLEHRISLADQAALPPFPHPLLSLLRKKFLRWIFHHAAVISTDF